MIDEIFEQVDEILSGIDETRSNFQSLRAQLAELRAFRVEWEAEERASAKLAERESLLVDLRQLLDTLAGDAAWMQARSGQYMRAGDHCVIRFKLHGKFIKTPAFETWGEAIAYARGM